MSAGSIAYLILICSAFGGFMGVLAYGYIRTNLPERKPLPPNAGAGKAEHRKAA